jgi:hypothetical protein
MDSRYKPTPHDNLLQRASGFLPAAESIPNNRYFDEAARSLIMITTILERPEVSNNPDYLNSEKDFKRGPRASANRVLPSGIRLSGTTT